MTLAFVSNYINHHQLPLCEALYRRLGKGFVFIQTMPMEAERVEMGWSVDVDEIPYVMCLYRDEYECLKRIMESDVVLFGWTGREDIVTPRLRSGRTVESGLPEGAYGEVQGTYQIPGAEYLYALRWRVYGVGLSSDRGVSG